MRYLGTGLGIGFQTLTNFGTKFMEEVLLYFMLSLCFSLLLHDFGLHVRKEEGDGEGSEGEMKELKRRTVLLLLYLLRSPFYENICESVTFFIAAKL